MLCKAFWTTSFSNTRRLTPAHEWKKWPKKNGKAGRSVGWTQKFDAGKQLSASIVLFATIFRLTNIQVNPSHQTFSMVVHSHNLACGIPPASMPGKTKIARRHLIHLTIVLLTSGPVHKRKKKTVHVWCIKTCCDWLELTNWILGRKKKKRASTQALRWLENYGVHHPGPLNFPLPPRARRQCVHIVQTGWPDLKILIGDLEYG